VIASDTFARTVTSGWGTASTGGPYTITNTAGTSVSGAAAHIDPLKPGHLFTARLTSAQAVDTRTTMSVVVPTLPSAGGL
jgi:hypothetical protein